MRITLLIKSTLIRELSNVYFQVRRSTRARQTRYDKEFINDSEDSEDERKKKKKSARSRGWLGDSDEEIDESELDSESAESDWGSKKRKRKPASR